MLVIVGGRRETLVPLPAVMQRGGMGCNPNNEAAMQCKAVEGAARAHVLGHDAFAPVPLYELHELPWLQLRGIGHLGGTQ